ncbi:hypothetical protein VE01_10144 [Pseudogymnoascus verrucosus]|uniref:2EXR domain-containing protein n=1 Tax=Pseudogymnoascus verrucosus TaxID=342668 RepID=A0A1B8G7S6_9PEZI|nr:uncharacterized protein VE01_10144 [Pseudogymnoascus verrucosus]OBT91886.1 hypothetical protein VE01_10144 [Pseudogymnoascus verrucosus]
MAAAATGPAHPPTPSTSLTTFPLFLHLPPEIRLSIWTLSFHPRTLELHYPRAHYANPHNASSPDSHGPPPFQSRSYNPAALSTSLESRNAALMTYSIALPLASEMHHRPPWAQRRVLYIAPDMDTLVLLGDEPAIRVTRLVKWIRDHLAAQASPITGLRNIGLSASQFANSQGAMILRFVGRDLFHDVERLVLVIGPRPGCGTEVKPPEGWDGGRCLLREFVGVEGEEGEERGHGEEEKEQFRGFQRGVGRQFREKGGWMVVGRNRMRIASVGFENGW